MLTADLVRARALDLGFDLVGLAPVGETPHAQRFVDWLAAGHQGQMAYLARPDALEKRLDPGRILPGVQTVILVGVSYETLAVPMDVLSDPARGRIARYAWGADYHHTLTPLLRAFGEWISKASRAYVDTGPVLERSWAEACGLGFIGKNTCLIHPRGGSYLFLGAVLVAEPILDPQSSDQAPEASRSRPTPHTAHIGCAACTRCLSACPTQAFPAPGVLDARRCISYLTIELRGSIPLDLRPHMGNWIFGCDVCQDVCPYVRRYSHPTPSRLGQSFRPIDVDRAAPRLTDVLAMTDTAFKARFKGTAVERTKRPGLVRNACIAAGNWGDTSALGALMHIVDNADEPPSVREHAQWALDRIHGSGSIYEIVE